MPPILTIVLAEVSVILLAALAIGLFIHLRRTRRHRTEFKAVMDIARHVGMSPGMDAGHSPADAPFPPVDEDFIERTNRSIGEIREAIARLDVKFGQFHLEDELRDQDIDHKIEEENSQILVMRKELGEVTAALHELRTHQAALNEELQSLRVEVERRAAQDARAGAMPAPAAAPGHLDSEVTLIDDFTLPDSVLDELDEVAKSAAAAPATRKAAPRHVTGFNSAPARMKPKVPRTTAAPMQKAAAMSSHAPAAKSAAVAQAVDEPQFAFDPAKIDDLFNAPYFIPGAANAGINVEELNYEDFNLDQPTGEADGPQQQPHYDADRVFYQSSPQTGLKAGWYFSLRGGKAHGPFGTKEAGERVLREMIEHFKRTGDSGGR
ncbi:MAG: hypothetical protein AB7R40_26210 [Nitrospiraceae bacterium]